MQEIVFEVDTKGEVKADAVGFVGTACENSLQKFQVLQSSQAQVVDKSELYASKIQQQEIKQW